MHGQWIDRARVMRTRSTRAENTIWRWLRNRYLGDYKFRRQHPVDSYILDFYCPELQLCIEVDGETHDTAERAAYDARRTANLARHGIHVLRLTNDHIATQPDGAWALIVDAVGHAAAKLADRESRPSP